jgi:hypothetical protein
VHGTALRADNGVFASGVLREWAEAASLGEAEAGLLPELCRSLDEDFWVCPGNVDDRLLDLVSLGAVDAYASEARFIVQDTDYGGQDGKGRPYKRTIRAKACPLLMPMPGPGKPGRKREHCAACRVVGSNLGKLTRTDETAEGETSRFDRMHKRTLIQAAEKNSSKLSELNLRLASQHKQMARLVQAQGKHVDEKLEALLTTSLRGEHNHSNISGYT